MKTPLVIMVRSAMSEQQKFIILANDLIRRLSYVQSKVQKERRVQNKEEKRFRKLGWE